MSRVLQQKCHRITSTSNIIFTRSLDREPLHKVQDLQKGHSTRLATKSAEARYEKLIVEDLDESSKTAYFSHKLPRYNRQQQKFELVQEARDLYNHILEDVLAGRDLNVYQGADFLDFFGETEPKRVSEVCLVNDHFMLVKMPEICWPRSTQIDSIKVKELNSEKDDLELVAIRNEPIQLNETRRSKARKYFNCNRSTKVSPIHEQMECGAGGDATNGSCNKVKSRPISSTWLRDSTEIEEHKTITKISGSKGGSVVGDMKKHNEAEVFRTITRISGNPRKSIGIKVGVEKSQLEEQPRQATALNFRTSNDRVVQAPSGDDISRFEAIEDVCVRDASHASLTHSYNCALHASVTLEHNGMLITPRRKKLLSSDKNYEAKQEAGGAFLEKEKPTKRFSRFNAFRWLLKTFRLRNQRKPKVKVHAVINKTYFVRWKKPPDDYINGFGVKSEIGNRLPILRRWRSATF